MAETVDLVRNAISQRRSLHHVVINVAKLINLQTDDELRRDVIESDIVGIDGMGIVLGARLLGVKSPQRVAGVDLMYEVLKLCEKEKFRPFFFGATQDVLDAAIRSARKLWPELDIAGARNGYFDQETEPEIVEQIRASGADCLFVAISTPVKERFCRRYRGVLGVPFVMGVGGSFDILAGKTSRAPRILQRLGLEWAFRLACEPRRMWRRYLFTNAAYIRFLVRALMSRPTPAITLREF